MSKQLTLFGRVAKPESKSKSSVYVMPSNDYEHYVERYYQRNRYRGKSKGCILKDVQQEWKSTYVKNPTLLSEYLAAQEGETAFTAEESPTLPPAEGNPMSPRYFPSH